MISIYSEITKSLQLMKLLYTVYTIYDEYLDLYIWFFINKQSKYAL